MDLEQLKTRLDIEDIARQYGLSFDPKGWSRCYFPDRHTNGDTTPSLYLDRKRQRIRCMAQGCFGDQGQDVIGLVQTIEGLDFKTALHKLAQQTGLNGHSTQPAQPSRIVANYDYQDEDGHLLYQVVRTAPGRNGRRKDFRIRQPDGKNGWLWNVQEVRLVPYRLPELIASTGPVIVVEGEACAEALHTLGLVATTNPMGAGKWPDDFGPHLAGREVIIWPDKDTAGYRHAEQVAQSLQGHATSIAMIAPPKSLPDRGDVVDGIKNNAWDRNAVQAIVDQAHPWIPNQAGDLVDKDAPTEDEEDAPPRESQAVRLVHLILPDLELFHDPHGTPFVRVWLQGHGESWPCASPRVRRWMVHRFYEAEGAVLSSEAVKAALGILEAKACFDGTEHTLHNRVAWQAGTLCYDMSDSAWRMVRITQEGWKIIDDPPILFRRHTHQAPQVDPLTGGNVHRLFDFVSVVDEDIRLLLLVWLIAGFIPGFPHPVPILHGPQGSGKSSAFRFLRRLLDPSTMETLTFPRDLNELVQKLSHHWAPLFDNATHLSPWLSDALCRAVTGEGFSKRQLYTDDEDQIYHFQRCIGLNGINIVATRADLLDRAILISLERIPPENRRTEEALEAEFQHVRPAILGGIFDTLVRALHIYPTLQLTQLPRMADFARWGCAIAQALGYTETTFLTAYARNLQQQNTEVLDGHPVAAAIMALMEDRLEWTGEPAALLRALEGVAEEQKINTRNKDWPGAAHVLTRRIKEVRPNLQEAGILLEERRSGRHRTWTLQRSKPSVTNVTTVTKADNPLRNNVLSDDAMGDASGDATESLYPIASPHTEVASPSEDATNPIINNDPAPTDDADDASDATLHTWEDANLRSLEL